MARMEMPKSMGHCKHNLRKLKFTYEDSTCECNKSDQLMKHFLEYMLQPEAWLIDDFIRYNIAVQFVKQ